MLKRFFSFLARRDWLLPQLGEVGLQPSMRLLTTSTIVLNILTLTLPVVMLIVFDRILPHRAIETMVLLIGGASIALILETILRVMRGQLTAWTAARFEHGASEQVASHILALPLVKYEGAGSGRHLERFKNVTQLKQHFSGQSFQQWLDLPFSLLYVLIITLISWPIALLMVLGYGAFAHYSLQAADEQKDPYQERLGSDQRRNNFLIETLANIHTLKSMTMEALMMRRYDRLQEASARAIERMSYIFDSSNNIAGLFGPMISMLVAALGAWLVIMGEMSSGELSVCIFLSLRSLAPLQRVGALWSKHKTDEHLATDLQELLTGDALRAGKAHILPALDMENAPAVAMQSVSFQFPGASEALLSNVQLTVARGETLCISGENGSGRSTLLGLIAGFMAPQKGIVRIFGKDIEDFDRAHLSHLIGYMPQRAVMYDGTLLQNVTMFRSELNDNAIEIARRLGLEDFILALPQGWETRVGDAASETLPPGLRQRIGVMRALVTNPMIILFDDTTASVDNEGEQQILRYLELARGKKTLIIVTQRPSLQRLATRTLYIGQGQLSEAPLAPRKIEAATGSSNVVSLAYDAEAGFAKLSAHAQEAYSGENYWARLDAAVASAFRTPNDLSSLVAPLLRTLGWRGPVRDVIESLPYFADTLDITGLINGMAKLGFGVTEVAGDLEAIDGRGYPCLILPDEGPAALLVERTSTGFLLQNQLGNQLYERHELGHGRSLFFTRDAMNTEMSGDWTRATVTRMRPILLQAALVSMLIGILMLSGSLFTMSVYNRIIPTGSIETLAYLVAGVLLSFGLVFTLIKHRARLLSYIAGRIEYVFGTAAMEKLMSLSPSYTERAAVGAQIARLGSFEAIRELFTSPLAATLLELPATLIIAVVLWIINPAAGPVILLVLAIYFVLYWMLEPIARARVATVGRLSTRRNEFLVEMITKMRGIRESRAESVWLERHRVISADAAMASYKVEQMAAILSGVAYLVMMLAGLIIVALTVPMAFRAEIGPGALIASIILLWRVLGPLQTLFTNISRIERVRSAANQFDALMRLRGERLAPDARAGSRNLRGNIEFSRVSFRYSMSADPAVVGLSINMPAGSITAVTGQNGSGKSTFFKLMLGMYTPQAGTIRIDGVDIRQMDPVQLRRMTGYVPQEMQFFRATIAQNLRFAQPDATDEEVREALALSGALDQVMQLPRGLDYRIGDSASEQIPASLRQKMALARAYLTRAPILLFDEPGTGLDNESDAAFMEALKALKNKRTVVFISHRPSHMKLADTVLLFRGGYLQGVATPDELFRKQA